MSITIAWVPISFPSQREKSALDFSLWEEVFHILQSNQDEVDIFDVELPEYIFLSDEWVFIDTQKLSHSIKMKQFLDVFFSSGYYFFDTQYQNLLDILYDKKTLSSSWNHKMKIAQSIRKIQPERIHLYTSWKIDYDKVDFLFDPNLIWPEAKFQKNYSFDELIACLWGNKIKFWLLKSEFLSGIQSTTPLKITIAKPEHPIAGKDAIKELCSQQVILDLSPYEDENGRINYKKLKNKIPQIWAWKVLYRKIPLQSWQDGIDIYGNKIPHKQAKDIDLEKFLWEWVCIEMRDGFETIVSEVQWFLVQEKWNKISVKEKMPPYKGDIDSSTWNLEIQWFDFILQWNIQEFFSLTGNSLFVFWNIYWKLHSKGGKVEIYWNISWSGKENENGKIYNDQGSIKMVWKLISRWELIARYGTIDTSEVKMIEMTRIEAKEIIGNHFCNCILVGETIQAKSIKNCIVIWKKVQIDFLHNDQKQYANNEIILVIEWNIDEWKERISQIDMQSIQIKQQIHTLEESLKKIEESLKKIGIAFDFDDKNIFDNQTKKYLQDYEKNEFKLKDKAYILNLDAKQKNNLAHFLYLINHIKQYNTVFHQIQKLQQNYWEWEKEKSKILDQIQNIQNNAWCSIGCIEDTLSIKQVYDAVINIVEVDLNHILSVLTMNTTLKEIYKTSWNQEKYELIF